MHHAKRALLRELKEALFWYAAFSDIKLRPRKGRRT